MLPSSSVWRIKKIEQTINRINHSLVENIEIKRRRRVTKNELIKLRKN